PQAEPNGRNSRQQDTFRQRLQGLTVAPAQGKIRLPSGTVLTYDNDVITNLTEVKAIRKRHHNGYHRMHISLDIYDVVWDTAAWAKEPTNAWKGVPQMAKAQRVVFSFDERSLESLQRIKDQGQFSSMADAVRESLQITRALQVQGGQGFTEIVVRNPE